MNSTQEMNPRAKAIMEWGYANGHMFTHAEVDALLRAICAAPLVAGKGKYDGQPEHAQRGWQPN